jgi:hypothetical protein
LSPVTSSPCGPMTRPASSNPTAAGSRNRRDSAGTPTMTAIMMANFVRFGSVSRCVRTKSIHSIS